MALGLIGIIIYSVLANECSGVSISETCRNSLIVNDTIECIILASMVMASVKVYHSIGQLDVNPNPISFLDDLLLVICLPSFFIYNIF